MSFPSAWSCKRSLSTTKARWARRRLRAVYAWPIHFACAADSGVGTVSERCDLLAPFGVSQSLASPGQHERSP